MQSESITRDWNVKLQNIFLAQKGRAKESGDMKSGMRSIKI